MSYLIGLVYLMNAEIYRIDHYLGKGINCRISLAFRFANSLLNLFGTVIISGTISVTEQLGVEGAAITTTDLARCTDMIQNHLLQLLLPTKPSSEAVSFESNGYATV